MGMFLQRGSTIGSVVGGLIGASDFVTTYGGSGLGVTTSAGEAVVPGSSSTTQSGYYIRGSSATTNTPSAASPSLPRIDLIYLQVNDAAYTGSTNSGTCSIATGTPTSGASLSNLSGAPSLPTSSLALAYILIPANASTISNSDISNVALAVKLGLPTSARLIAQIATVVAGSTSGSASYFVGTNGNTVAAGGNIAAQNGVQGLITFAGADWTLGANNPQLTVRATAGCNATSPGTTLGIGLGTGIAFAGATGTTTITLSSSLGGATVTPSASSIVSAEFSFAFPANGTYCLFVETGATTAAASEVALSGQLWANA